MTLPRLGQPSYRVIEQRGNVALVVVRIGLRARFVIMRRVLRPEAHALYNPETDNDPVLYNRASFFDAVQMYRTEPEAVAAFETFAALEPMF